MRMAQVSLPLGRLSSAQTLHLPLSAEVGLVGTAASSIEGLTTISEKSSASSSVTGSF